MSDIDKGVRELYFRLAGRRDMNHRTAMAMALLHRSQDFEEARSKRLAYQNAINDLCIVFGVTEEELRS